MSQQTAWIYVCLIGGLLLIAIFGFISSLYLKDDNRIEEIAEEIIYQKTGLDLDLTPGSPEK